MIANSFKSVTALLSIALLSLALSGCAPLVVGGTAATTVAVASDRRTTGEQVDDKTIQLKANSELSSIFGNKARFVPVSYAGHVLLLGDVPTEADKQKAEEAVKQIEPVNKVTNRLRVGEITPLSVRTNDTWLTTKVTTTLINTADVPTRTMVITTERGRVYLMGKVTPNEAERAAKAAAQVTGVNEVIKVFDIISPEQLRQQEELNAELNRAADTQPANSSSSSSNIETMPVQ